MNDSKLESAIALCREPRFNGTTYDCQLCDDCEELMYRIRLITAEAKKAKKQVINSFWRCSTLAFTHFSSTFTFPLFRSQCIGEQVEVVVDAANRIHLSNDTIAYLSGLLNGDPKRFMEKQIALETEILRIV